MAMQLNTKRILIFLAIACGVPLTVLMAIYVVVRTEDLIRVAAIVGIFLGFTPALANVATRLITKEGWKDLWLRPNVRRGWRFYLAAWLLPLLATIVGGGIFFLLFPQAFDPNFSELRKTFASSPFLAANPWVGMLVTTLKNIIIGLAYGMLYFGEEFGWRAYLLPKLIGRFTSIEPAQAGGAGARKAALLVGVIWGVWHWPGYFLSMQVVPGFPILFPLVVLVSTCALSVLLSWVTLRSGSIWPASIGHGVINNIPDLPRSLMQGPANVLIGPGPSGLIGGLGYLILALVLLLSRGAFAGEEKRAGAEMGQAAVTNHS